jgi:ribosome-associated protein
MPQSEPQKPNNESKSQRKRDMLALQKIGESLIKLTEEQLATVDLPDNLFTAIQHMKSLTSNEAKRRQLQFIGKIMRQIDPELIKEALKRIEFIHEINTAQFHRIEEWRTKLLMYGDDALNSFLVDYPNVDRQQLRQLIRNAQQDRKNNKNTGAEKALFRFLRSLIYGSI